MKKMSTSIAFLSGKGGSGKTTLALGIADLLCRCNVNTLLVDCDISTNGATYFYESQLTDQNRNERFQISSFHDLLYTDANRDLIVPTPFQISSELDFIPSVSITSYQYQVEEATEQNHDFKIKLQNFFDWAQNKYDVILFDCQAGYTEFLPILLPLMDVDLFVLEADSISASAMRSLHLKIGNYLGHAKLYQIFNKATPEEFDIYSKIVGTFFTNIGTLLFDWKIRQAFSRSQVPDIENTSIQYGFDLCNICKIIFVDKFVQERLNRFSNQLMHQKLEEEYKQIEKELYKLTEKPQLSTKKLIYMIFSFFSVIAILLTLYTAIPGQNDLKIIFLLYSILLILIAIIAFILILTNFDRNRGNHQKQQEYERKLKQINKEMKKYTD